jgi:hypothetical protein
VGGWSQELKKRDTHNNERKKEEDGEEDANDFCGVQKTSDESDQGRKEKRR